MTIYYCLIANQYCPLAEYNNGGEKKMYDIAQRLLKKLTFEENSIESVNWDGITYSYRIDNHIVYICVTDEAFGIRSANLFLRHVNQVFEQEFSTRGQATKLKLDLNRDFAPKLKTLMETFSSSSGLEKLQALQKDLDEAKNHVAVNISKVLERGDKVELLVDKTNDLNSQASEFAKSSQALRRHLWIQNMKWTIGISLIVCSFLLLTLVYIQKKMS